MAFTLRLVKGNPLTWAEFDNNLTEIEAKWLEIVTISNNALAAANFVGQWNSLTGPLSPPAATFWSGKYWLLLNYVFNVAAAEPGVSSAWAELVVGNVLGPVSATVSEIPSFQTADGKTLRGGSGLLVPAQGFLSGVAALNQGALDGQRNIVLNGSFEHAQRGTSFNITTANTNFFTLDRWGALQQTTAAVTVSRVDSSRASGRFAARVQRNAGSAGVGNISFTQAIERSSCHKFRGRTVTLSFVARRGANYSAASGNLVVRLRGNASSVESATATAHTGSGSWSVANVLSSGDAALTTTATQFTFTTTVPANIQQLAVLFAYTPTGTAGADDWFEVEDVRLEQGEFTPYAVQDPFYDWLNCLRHYYRRQSLAANDILADTGHHISTTQARVITPFPVPMRVPPTALEQSGAAGDYRTISSGVTAVGCSAVPTFVVASRFNAMSLFTVASGLTLDRWAYGASSNANAFLGWSADL